MREKRLCREPNAQVAIEFIIIVGIVLLIVVAVTPTILKQQELNKAVSAARDGAAFGASMRGMGYYTSNIQPENRNPQGIVKIKEIIPNSQGIEASTGKEKYQIRIRAVSPNYLSENYKSTIESSIENYARSYVNYAFTGVYQGGFNPVYTSYYRFTFTANLTSYGD